MLDERQLLSEDGLRSLSKADISYGTLDNYWRGPVWMPINYLVLRACKKFYS
jgi:mannosyl-oligosaccharide glucosidase